MCWCAHKTAFLTSIQHTVSPLFPQLSVGLSSSREKQKKLSSQQVLLHFSFSRGTYFRHAKYQGGFSQAQQYRISKWAEFQVWKFLNLQKLAHGNKSLPLKSRRPQGDTRFFFPHANFRVKFPYLKPKKLYTCKSQPSG